MLDKKKAVKGTKHEAGNREEVECGDYLAVVLRKASQRFALPSSRQPFS